LEVWVWFVDLTSWVREEAEPNRGGVTHGLKGRERVGYLLGSGGVRESGALACRCTTRR
jgi:hypothetical protein